ncbi:probable mitochondrial import inner membrane translocase subunit TIM21 [Daucus carota subsp. sativus]|uniref:Mitochondrial import inner membrane translocase subunit Tim21 n=1 Tax=Daucus carota subsp. sativus TaxID=79200 RepID=A0A164TUC9_DAUCS|nr:PREDICTED: probable mitochondrial import inner membrane translocase subunit TIM21 [Daucus carota subsp. sativus]
MFCTKSVKRAGLLLNRSRWITSFSKSSDGVFNHVASAPADNIAKRGLLGPTGIGGLFRRNQINNCLVNYQSLFHLSKTNTAEPAMSSFARAFASQTSKGKDSSKREREISTVEDPFDAPTYNIPQKPVTFTEGASYSLVILAGLGIAAAAAYGVFSELIFSPKEYKVFGMALKRVQNDSQVSVRIGSPVTGYGQDSRNRAARQRIPHRIWTDEDGVEHVEVNFFVRGPHGYGKVFTEMFKDKEEKQWKFTYMIVEIDSPSKAQLMLESYIPGVAT